MTPQVLLPIDVTTVGAGVSTINVGNLNAVGSACTFLVRLEGQQNNAERGAQFFAEGNAARNVIGNGFATGVLVSPGYTDAAAVPWTTVGAFPAGWAAAMQFSGNIIQLAFNGAAGQTVLWRGQISAWLYFGALAA